MKQVRLNRVEVWIADHALPIFGVVALVIIAGAIAIALVFMQAQQAGDQVNVLKPQVTRVNKAICDKQSLGHAQRAERCAERIRVGLINCRHSNPCRAAFLAIATYPPKARSGSPSSTTAITAAPSSKGVMPQQPSSNGHQQPGPGDPGPRGGGNEDHGQGASPAPSPGPSPAPGASAAPEASPPAETPGNGAQGASPSGVGVEVCALERTCVGAEVDVSPKGLTP